jgi:hypothetical protein
MSSNCPLEDHIPLHPTRKHHKGGVQLKLHDTFDMQTRLPSLSYIRIDSLKEVPLQVLREVTRPDGLRVMLQEKSFKTLVNLAGGRKPS